MATGTNIGLREELSGLRLGEELSRLREEISRLGEELTEVREEHTRLREELAGLMQELTDTQVKEDRRQVIDNEGINYYWHNFHLSQIREQIISKERQIEHIQGEFEYKEGQIKHKEGQIEHIQGQILLKEQKQEMVCIIYH